MVDNQVITIYTEANPNPNSMKFMLNFMLMADGITLDFVTEEDAEKSPLAKELLALDYVERVFFMSNFITITKKEEVKWEEISPVLRSFIKNYLEAKKPVFSEDLPEQEITINTDSEAVKKIKGVLDEYIKPAVEQDGGAISFHSFDEITGIVKVTLQGSCSGCPSSTFTLKAGIEALLKRFLPGQVNEVVAEGV